MYLQPIETGANHSSSTAPRFLKTTRVNPTQCRVMRITQLGDRTADSFLRTSIVPCTFPSVFRIDVIIVGVSSSASLILVPAEAATARRRRIYSVDVARCQVYSSGELQAEDSSVSWPFRSSVKCHAKYLLLLSQPTLRTPAGL